jgi:hypothetical protein
MKTAVFVLGPESSGTRMLTEAFVRLGFCGSSGHEQTLDNLDFSNSPDRIVLRRSLPHNSIWPPIKDICVAMRQAGYRHIIPILIVRDKEMTIQSQCNPKNRHVLTAKAARARIEYALQHGYAELAEADLVPIVVHYEPFIKFESVRRVFFKKLDLNLPNMPFWDGNRKYRRSAKRRKAGRPSLPSPPNSTRRAAGRS